MNITYINVYGNRTMILSSFFIGLYVTNFLQNAFFENNTMEVMRRDTLEKETRSCDGIEEYVQQLLEDIQNNIYQKALNYRNEHIVKVDSYDDFKEQIEKGGFILAHWDGTPETEDRIKEETKATIRCLPFDADEESLTPGKCMVTGKPSARRVLFARAY